MPVTKERKQEQLKQLIEKIKKAKSITFAAYKGINVSDQTKLRNSLREGGAELKVAKKTLIRLAAKEIGIEEIDDDILEGQIVIAFSYEEPTVGPQGIKKLAKGGKIELKGGIFEGRLLSLEEVQELADLPSREVLIGKLMGTLMAPVSGFSSIGSGVIGGFVRVLNGYAVKQ